MKFSTSLLTALAPVALAKSVRNHYPRGAGRKALPPGLSLDNGIAGFGITEEALTEVIILWVNPGLGAATTTINQQTTVTQTVTAGGGKQTAAAAAAATHTVTVGGSAGLVYTPDSITANMGDTVVFSFESQNHTVSQSAFATPCEPLQGGMDSGFQANPNNTMSPPPQVAMQVMVTTPLWFYCRQKGHCGKGMTFSINPTAAKTQAMFQSMAIAQNGTGSSSGITGGKGTSGGSSGAGASAGASGAGASASASANAGGAGASAAAGSSTSLAQLPGATTAATATQAAGATGTGSIIQGTGTTLPDGSCACAVVVGAGAFPAVQVQGLSNFGGMPGSLPMAMAEK